MIQARAAVLNRTGLDGIDIDVVSLDDPHDREVLVRVVASGLCHSDLHVIDGTLPSSGARVLGHEMSGIVEQVGNLVSTVAPGDRVVACLAMACGGCAACLAGQPNLCVRRAELWARPSGRRGRVTAGDGAPLVAGSGIGGLAEYTLIDERGLVTVPDAMPLVPAALLGCAVLTGTGAVFRSARVTPAASVAVIGCGGVGLSIIQAARISGAHPIVAVDRAPQKLEVAVALGATHTVLSVVGSGEHLEQIRSITRGLGVDFSFEAVGSATTAQDAVSILARRGTAIIVGVFPAGIEIKVPARDMLTRETRLQGSYMGSSVFRRDIPQLCQMYLAGTLHLDRMIDPQIKLDDVRHGFELLAAGAAVRPVVVLDDLPDREDTAAAVSISDLAHRSNAI